MCPQVEENGDLSEGCRACRALIREARKINPTGRPNDVLGALGPEAEKKMRAHLGTGKYPHGCDKGCWGYLTEQKSAPKSG